MSIIPKKSDSVIESFTIAIAKVTSAAENFSKSTGERQAALIAVGISIADLKTAFEVLPTVARPEASWKAYIKKSAPDLGLGFRSARQADNYIKLVKDYQTIPEKIRQEKLGLCGSYRELRATIDQILRPKATRATRFENYEKLVRRIRSLTAKAILIAPANLKAALENADKNLAAAVPSATEDKAALDVAKPFLPENVGEIAELLGGKTALGRAVGKQNAHASYWVRKNKLPAEHIPVLIATLVVKGFQPDLSRIPKIAEKPAA